MNHALIGIYDVKTRTVDYVAPSFDCGTVERCTCLNW
jgi:hypothetical protein